MSLKVKLAKLSAALLLTDFVLANEPAVVEPDEAAVQETPKAVFGTG